MLYEYYGVNPNNAPAEPIEIFFGRLVRPQTIAKHVVLFSD